MFKNLSKRIGPSVAAVGAAALSAWCVVNSSAALPLPKKTIDLSPADALEHRFTTDLQPFLERYCHSCHGVRKPKAELNLSRYPTVASIVKNIRVWELVLERLQAREMPPAGAPRRPTDGERMTAIAWLRDLRDREARRTAGDPGIVLARRLSNAECDYTVRDLTGVDLRPTREFPVDPANEAGFDNSGESLAMSPALLRKYFGAMHSVADHVVLKPEGFVFAPHPVVTDTDRDKYCVQRIIDFYQRHQVDYAAYFLAAWKYRHCAQRGRPTAELSAFAAEGELSEKYLALVWAALTEPGTDIGPLAAVRKRWRDLSDAQSPENAVRLACERMRDLVLRLCRQLKPRVAKLAFAGASKGTQPVVLWNNRLLAARHRSYDGDPRADLPKLGEQCTGADAGLAELFRVKPSDAEIEKRLRGELERFCTVFPETFVVTDRGPYFDVNGANKGRPLTAGFHLMVGYFRDDEPLCDFILNDRARRELDALWNELNFVTFTPRRQYKDFIFFERSEGPNFLKEAEFDFARSEDKDIVAQAKINRLAKAYLAKARRVGATGDVVQAIETYFRDIGAEIRQVEGARLAAEPSHLAALVQFAERAYRRPLTAAERDGVLAFYRKLRIQDELGHEDAVRDTLVSVLMSPHFSYRFDLAAPGTGVRPLSDYELASRLSYFLWSSMPDAELLAHAAAGDLHRPKVLTAQARRMVRDPKVRGLATEFAGNWLDFRRFEEHNSVDRGRFPSFTNELRQAMFEEPVRYFMEVAQSNRCVLDLLHGADTFVNRSLARHYGMPEPAAGGTDWMHVTDARRYGRGGLLPMAIFLTRNSPGLRTSPVKRGYWVVRRVLSEQIPPPPATVPELPRDEANLAALTLPQLLARHRDNASCAGCHRRFDSVGLVFEGFGPIGERRTKDLGGRRVLISATFPDGKDRTGLDGLRAYLREKRQDDFVDNLCRKLLSYALGRSLQLSDRPTLDTMKARLATDGYAFGGLVDVIVTSPQFLNKRGRDESPRK